MGKKKRLRRPTEPYGLKAGEVRVDEWVGADKRLVEHIARNGCTTVVTEALDSNGYEQETSK